eukprot:COSAG06_NODE_69085_length_198_cov_436.666667_1_plen_40_part_01
MLTVRRSKVGSRPATLDSRDHRGMPIITMLLLLLEEGAEK